MIQRISRKQKNLSFAEISDFCNELSMLIKSGITPSSAIDILLIDTKDNSAQIILKRMQEILHQGMPLSEAINDSKVFPPYVYSMIKMGEESGNLDVVLSSLSDYYEREYNLSEDIRSAVLYPLIMVTMMFMVILILVTKVMPIFGQVFAQLGTSLNSFSNTLLNIGQALNNWALFIAFILIILGILFVYSTQTTNGHKLFKKVSGNIRPFKQIYHDLAAARFAGTMSLAISSGMDTYNALNIVSQIVESKEIEESIKLCRKKILEGDSFPEAVEKTNIFSKLYNQMVLVGFRSGSMDQVLDQIAGRYETAVARKISNTLSILEPTLVIFLSIVVGMILLAVILPLMGIMSTIG